MENMEASFKAVLRGKHRKTSRVGRLLIANKDAVIAELQRRISDGSYRVSGYREMHIVEAGKSRTIQVVPLKDRIAVNAIMRVVDEHLHVVALLRVARETDQHQVAAHLHGRDAVDAGQYVRKDMRDALPMAGEQRAAVLAQSLDGFLGNRIRQSCHGSVIRWLW